MRKVLVSITLVLFCLLNATFVVSCSQHSKTASVSDTLHGAIKSIETDAAHSMVVMEDGSLWAWGDNQFGQLGDGTTENRSSPIKIMDDVLMVSTNEFTMAVKNDGTLWGWGRNNHGQLGDGTTEDQYSPVKIMDDVTCVSVGGYANHAAVVKTDGSVWAWEGRTGVNYSDDITFYYPQTPAKIMENAVYVSCGGSVTMALLEDGTLWGWGDNSNGALGDGTATGRISPVLIMENVTYIKANAVFTAAITTDGSLWTWGFNQYGMLGDSTRTDRYTPVKIKEDVVYVNGTKAITADGTLWAWHLYETLDDDGKYLLAHLSDSPVAVMDNVAQVAATSRHALMLMKDGSLWAWGRNDFGQLGDPSISYSHSPIKIYDPN